MQDESVPEEFTRTFNDGRRMRLDLPGVFEFIGGPKDGQSEEVPLRWIKVVVSGHLYRLAVIESDDNPPIRYCLMSNSMFPKELRT